MKINIKANPQQVQEALDAGQKRARTRILTLEDLDRGIEEVEARLKYLPQKYRKGIRVQIQEHETFPSSYKGYPQGTYALIEWVSYGWALIDVKRSDVPTPAARRKWSGKIALSDEQALRISENYLQYQGFRPDGWLMTGPVTHPGMILNNVYTEFTTKEVAYAAAIDREAMSASQGLLEAIPADPYGTAVRDLTQALKDDVFKEIS